MLFSQILEHEYSLVSVLSSKKSSSLIRYRNKTLGQDIVVRRLETTADTSVYEKLSQIKSRNLTQVYDVIREDNFCYIAEEFINGTPLSEFIPMSERGVKRVIVGLCQGLYTLHSMGIIHRDIKESNVLIDENAVVKLTDFDISKLYKPDSIKDTCLLGTATYAPPEQYGLAQTDLRSDIYALGILINILHTGKHPSVELYTKGKLGKIIRKATMINPQERFDSVTQIIDLL